MDDKALQARYRSTFVSSSDPSEHGATIKGYVRAAGRGYVELVEDFLRISRMRQVDAFNIFRLQMWMLQNVLAIQPVIAEAKSRLEAGGLSDDERDAIVAESVSYQTTIKAIREVGSGMVWRALGHDRAAYYLLGQGHRIGAMEEAGLTPELMELGRVVNTQEGIPILGGLTNCLRIGDLIVLSEQREGERLITVCEVKTKKNRTERFRRQRERQKSVVTLLNEGKGVLEKAEHRISVREIDQENYLPAVLNLLQEARRRGAAGRTFDNYLRVDCVDLRSVSEDPLQMVVRQASATLDAWAKRGDLFGPMSQADLKVPTVSLAPYSVFPFPEDICAALLMNAMIIVSTVNVSEVLRRFEMRGWSVIKGPEAILAEVTARSGDPRTEAGLAEIRKGSCNLVLPPTILGRIGLEFLRPRAVLRELDLVFEEGPGGSGPRLLSYYPDEQRIWR